MGKHLTMACYLVALTGGIGSGKSTVALFFKELKVPIFDSDVIAREIVAPGTPLHFRISAHFGNKILNPDNTLNRVLLREKIFMQPQEKKWIEDLLHPPIINELLKRAESVRTPYCILVIPLLTELLTKNEELGQKLRAKIQRILAVDASTSMQKQRILERESISTSLINAMIHAQANRIERLNVADDIITNTGDISYLKKQVENLHREYLRLAAEKAKQNEKI